MLGMSLKTILFPKGTAIPSESSQKYLDLQKKGLQEINCKNKNLLYKHLRTPSEACPQWTLLRNESKEKILPGKQFVFWQEIPSNYNSKISYRTNFDEKILV
jgi:hypothetical protein